MESFDLLLQGFGTALSLQNFFAAMFGAVLGIIVGAMPGLGSVTGVALLLPLTFGMPPTTAIIMLAAIYYANMYGGSYSAILLNIPGDSPAVMTALDGYPLSKQGKAGKALFTSNISSFIGGTIGIIILTFMGPALATIGLAFGPPEVFSLILFALCSIGWLLGDSPLKGLTTTFLGILLATVGVSMTLGQSRFAFGSTNLLAGIAFIPLVIGMFGFSQVMEMMTFRKGDLTIDKRLTIRESLLSKSEIKRVIPPAIRSGVLGTFVGILPGAGATTGSFMTYILQKKIGKNKEKMGTGVIEGVAAAEAGNNSAAAGSFAPLLSLGIPGSGTSAVLLGGLMMWGLTPGPLLVTNEPEFFWGLIASMYIGNAIVLLMALAMIPFLIYILRVPTAVMVPVITAVCIVGAYSVNNNMFDVYMMLIVGVIGFIIQKYKFPVAPLLLAFVLTPRIETSLRQSFDMSMGDPTIFFTRPISATLLSMMMLFFILPPIIGLYKKKKAETSGGTPA